MAKLKLGSLFSGIGGFDLGAEQAGWEVIWQSEIEPHCRKVLRTRFPRATLHGDLRKLTASAPGCLARTYRLQASVQDSTENAQDYFLNLRESCASFDPLGLSLRMFPDFSVQTMDETLRKSSGFSWSSAGMGFAGVCSTASFSESPSAAEECSLSDVLESHVPQRFFLSPRAAAGILRRAMKRGRQLPHRLGEALTNLAGQADSKTPGKDGGTTTIQPRPCELQKAVDHSNPILQSHSRPAPDTTATAAPEEMEATTSSFSRPSLPSGPKEVQVQRDTSTTTSRSRLCSQQTADHLPTKPAETTMSVRRLTPTECETLQGFPKGWTVPATALSEMPSPCKSPDGYCAEF